MVGEIRMMLCAMNTTYIEPHNFIVSIYLSKVELQKLSNQLLKYHKLLIGLESWRLRCSKSIVPILLELIEALPAFAKSGRDCEVCSHLRLINGYLLVSFPCLDGDADTWITLKGRKSDVGSALACSEAINVIKKSFGGERMMGS